MFKLVAFVYPWASCTNQLDTPVVSCSPAVSTLVIFCCVQHQQPAVQAAVRRGPCDSTDDGDCRSIFRLFTTAPACRVFCVAPVVPSCAPQPPAVDQGDSPHNGIRCLDEGPQGEGWWVAGFRCLDGRLVGWKTRPRTHTHTLFGLIVKLSDEYLGEG